MAHEINIAEYPKGPVFCRERESLSRRVEAAISYRRLTDAQSRWSYHWDSRGVTLYAFSEDQEAVWSFRLCGVWSAPLALLPLGYVMALFKDPVVSTATMERKGWNGRDRTEGMERKPISLIIDPCNAKQQIIHCTIAASFQSQQYIQAGTIVRCHTE